MCLFNTHIKRIHPFDKKISFSSTLSKIKKDSLLIFDIHFPISYPYISLQNLEKQVDKNLQNEWIVLYSLMMKTFILCSSMGSNSPKRLLLYLNTVWQ